MNPNTSALIGLEHHVCSIINTQSFPTIAHVNNKRITSPGAGLLTRSLAWSCQQVVDQCEQEIRRVSVDV